MHILIVGQTGTGKSTLAKQIAAKFLASGRHVVVLDPLASRDWPKGCDVFYERDEFDGVIEKNTGLVVIVDEGAVSVGRDSWDLAWLFRFGRHWGHKAIVITQYPADLPPIVRQQCTKLFTFRLSPKAADLLRKEGWKIPEDIDLLEKGEYYYIEAGSNHIRKGVVRFENDV